MNKLIKNNLIINFDKYKIIKSLAKNTSQGEVLLVEHIKSGKLYAYKKLKDKEVSVVKNLKAISKINLPDAFIVPKIFVNNKNEFGYLMEYLDPNKYVVSSAIINGFVSKDKDGKNVKTYFDIDERLHFCIQLVYALLELEGSDLMYADLKFENIYINKESKDIKIIDFDSIVKKGSNTKLGGSLGFIPPLVAQGKEKIDDLSVSFSFAIMVFMSLFKIHPFLGKRQNDIKNTKNINKLLFQDDPKYIFDLLDYENHLDKDLEEVIKTQYNKVPVYLKEAFHKTFSFGLYDKKFRKSLYEWKKILTKLTCELYRCSTCKEEYYLSEIDHRFICNSCKSEVMDFPIIVGDRQIALRPNLVVYKDYILDGNSHQKLFTVIKRDYQDYYRLRNDSCEIVTFTLPDGRVFKANPSQTFPITEVVAKYGKYELKIYWRIL